MNEYYNKKENKSIDEYKKFEAEEYYKAENIAVKDDYIKKILESFSEKEEIKTNKIINEEKKAFTNNNNNNSNNNTTPNLDNNKINEVAKIEKATEQVAKEVVQSSATIVGSVTAAAAGAVGVVALAINVLASNAKMNVIELTAGADYVSYKVDISELDEGIEYYIKIENDYFTYKQEVNDNGIFEDVVKGLKSYSNYTLTLETYDEKVGIVPYSTYSFNTLKASSPTVVFTSNYDINKENGIITFNYEAYISDLNDNGSDYYVETYINDEFYSKENTVVDSYIKSSFDILNDSTITMYAYATVYDEVELLGMKTVNVHIDEDYSTPTYEWISEDIVVASRNNNNKIGEVQKEEVKATYEIVQEPTCEKEGIGRYVANFTNAAFETQTKEVTIEPLNHDYKFIEFIFSEDGKQAQAKFVCNNDSSHEILYDADITSEVLKEATCEDLGTTRYTATYGDNTSYKDVDDIEPLGHEYGEVEYIWSDDNSTVTAKAICKQNENHIIEETVEATYEIIEEATEESVGLGRYTATFENDLFEVQNKNIEIPIAYDLDKFNIDKCYISTLDGGYKLNISLNNYNSDIKYTLSFSNTTNEIEDLEFESKDLEISRVEGNLDEISFVLNLEYNNETTSKQYNLKDFMDIEATFNELEYDEELNKYYIPVSVTSTIYTIENINVTLYDNDNNMSEASLEDGRIYLINPEFPSFYIRLSIDYSHDNIYGTHTIDSEIFNLDYGVTLDEINYLGYDNLIELKPRILAPEGYDLILLVDDTEVIPETTRLPDGYMKYHINSINSGEVKYYLSNGENNINGGTFNIDLSADLTKEGSSTTPNPFDCGVTYNSDGTINIFIPVEVNYSTPNTFVRVQLSNSATETYKYYDVSNGSLTIPNIEKQNYSLVYYRMKTIDGINYLTESSISVSGAIEFYSSTYHEDNSNTLIVHNIYNNVESFDVKYSDGTIETLTGNIDITNGQARITIPEGKTPVQVTYEYTNSNTTYDNFYWDDETFNRYGITKIGSDTMTITAEISW